ncbi:hypothetical protein DL96DRAFT_759504 [Flagelloscypha sp. PMI_526]|nr:hypothetical protein DL96DRAFT_759504 [Flagelloscypha sp. PMI_526]
MSLGPSYVRLAARTPNVFDDLASTWTQITQNAASPSVPRADVPEEPLTSSGTLEQVGTVTGLSSVFPVNWESTRRILGDEDDENFHKRTSIMKRDKKNPLDGFLGTLSGSFAPTSFFDHFFKRNEDETQNLVQPDDATNIGGDGTVVQEGTPEHPPRPEGSNLPPPLIAGLYSPNTYLNGFVRRDDSTDGESPVGQDGTTEDPSIVQDGKNEAISPSQDQANEAETGGERPHIVGSLITDPGSGSIAAGFSPTNYFSGFHKRTIARRLILDDLDDDTFEGDLAETEGNFEENRKRFLGPKPVITGHAHRDIDSGSSRIVRRMHQALKDVSARELD